MRSVLIQRSAFSNFFKPSWPIGWIIFISIACLLMVLFFGISPSKGAEPQAEIQNPDKIKLGALFRNSPTGERHRAGIHQAVHDFFKDKGPANVTIVDHEYTDENEGLKRLRELLEGKKGKVDIVLGPTDSGVFVDALRQRAELEKYQVPVISSQVTTAVPIQEEGWFFRTNVDIKRRVQTIYNFLNKYPIRSIAVIYKDTEFAERAEEAFNKMLAENQKRGYQTVKWVSLDDQNDACRRILDVRPEAVGLFGDRQDIKSIYKKLQTMNSGISLYNPIFFTMIDARETGIDNLHYASLVKRPSVKPAEGKNIGRPVFDEAEGLAYDTTIYVLSLLEEHLKTGFEPVKFRNQFMALMKASPLSTHGAKTDMAFNDLENIAQLGVINLKDGKVEIFDLEQTVSLFKKARMKAGLLSRRFGPMMGFNLILLMGIVAGITIIDLRRWYRGASHRLFISGPFYLLILFNVTVSLSLYLFLAETGQIRYDSLINVLIIAVAPMAIMRTTFFETPAGKAIGLANMYDRFLMWVNDKLMIGKYRSQHANINAIAYHNSITEMKHILNQFHQFARNPSQRKRLEEELEKDLDKARSLQEKRTICARRLLNNFDWDKDLHQRMGLLPEGFEEKNPKDPEVIIKKTVEFCLLDRERMKSLEMLLDNYMQEKEKKDDALYAVLKKDLDEALRSVKADRGRLSIKSRFLYIQFDLREEKLKAKGYLPEDFSLASAEVSIKYYEKRAAKRVPVKEPVNVQVMNRKGISLDIGEAQIENVSMGGALLSHLQMEEGLFPVNTPFDLEINVTEGDLSGLTAQATPVRFDYENDEVAFGIRFHDLDQNSKEMIQNYTTPYYSIEPVPYGPHI